MNSSFQIGYFTFILLVVLPMVISTYFWNWALYKELAQHKNTTQLLEATEGARREFDRLRFTDVVTRIPNQLQWVQDLLSLHDEVNVHNEFQVILIDLDGFKSINDRFGFEKGDEVIAIFAQILLESMRRNEKIYKRPFEDIVDTQKLWTRIYRKYSGGDEFIFLIRGDEEEALGFLIRVHRLTVRRIKSKIEEITREGLSFDFHGAVCPIFPKDTAQTALLRLEQCYRKATMDGFKRRVYWYSVRSSKNITDARQRKTYEDAEREFACSL